VFRDHWWAAVATVARLTGDLQAAEDGVQDACLVAIERWATAGMPDYPKAWLIGVARHKAIDRIRREARRGVKEVAAMHYLDGSPDGPGPPSCEVDDELSLIFLCCHPALNPDVRIALTLRAVCGLTTQEIAAAFLVPEPTMAKRLVRAKHKIRDAGISLRLPANPVLSQRTADVLRVIYLIFTEGHMATSGDTLIRGELCDSAVGLARGLHDRLPDEPEPAGLLALLLLTDARRPARTDPRGELVLLEDQDRSLWDQAKIAEGERLLTSALVVGRPGPYQLWAAIAACHSTSRSSADTDWRQISLLYGELLHYEATAVVEANRAIAVAMAEGPAAGLVILDVIATDRRLGRWPQLHIARGDLLARLDRIDESVAAYRSALELEPSSAERTFIHRRVRSLTGP
jgi:RNA polymerase sigma-70 factor (ECF subfamily)